MTKKPYTLKERNDAVKKEEQLRKFLSGPVIKSWVRAYGKLLDEGDWMLKLVPKDKKSKKKP